jgi:DNA-binding transcriptional MerR regulator
MDPADGAAYNTAAVVQRTGVPATTFRAWERRYGYPKPRRDAGGQRLYSERDIEGIRWLSQQTAQGVAISRAVAMLRSGHAAPPQALQNAPATLHVVRSLAVVCSDLLESLLAYDIRRAELVLAEAFALFSVADVCTGVFEPLLVEVGERWHAGELSVADEHHVTAFIQGRLFALLSAYQHPQNGPLVFTACAPDEWHEIGILLVSMFVAQRGIAVRYFGPNLPLEELAKVVAQHHPVVVALSAQSRATARKLRRAAQLLAAGTPPHPTLVFGGQAFNDDPALRESVDGTYAGPDAIATTESIVRLVEAVRSRAQASG